MDIDAMETEDLKRTLKEFQRELDEYREQLERLQTAVQPLYWHEVKIVSKALETLEEMWPFDPEAASDVPMMVFAELDGEVLAPERFEVRHFDGYRIGWIKNLHNEYVFERDYREGR